MIERYFRYHKQEVLESILRYLIFAATMLLTGCKQSHKHEVGDCTYAPFSATYHKIVGLTDEMYSVQSCLSVLLEDVSVDECFRNNLSQQSFRDFEENRDYRQELHPYLPIKCSEIK